MAWFPLFTRMDEMRCLVVGGGRVALHKAQTLMSFGGHVRVVAPDVLPELAACSVELVRRTVQEEDVTWAGLVVDATGDPQVGEMLSHLCTARGVPLNVVDRPELCTFIFPAILRKGPLVAGISTGGASPTAAAWVRNRLGEMLPEKFEDILIQLQALRICAQTLLDERESRAAWLSACFALALERERALTDGELRQLWEDFT